MQIQAQSTISNFGVSGLTAGVQTSFPNGENGKAHVYQCSNSTFLCHGALNCVISCQIGCLWDRVPLLHLLWDYLGVFSYVHRFLFTLWQITYSHDFAALHAKIHGFKAAPDLELSANLGNKKLFAGGSLLYNTDSRNINMTRAGRFSELEFQRFSNTKICLNHLQNSRITSF